MSQSYIPDYFTWWSEAFALIKGPEGGDGGNSFSRRGCVKARDPFSAAFRSRSKLRERLDQGNVSSPGHDRSSHHPLPVTG